MNKLVIFHVETNFSPLAKQVLSELKPFQDELTYVSPNFPSPLSDSEMANRLSQLEPLSERSIVIINDHYRSTPSSRILSILSNYGILHPDTKILIARGTHPAPPTEKQVELVGKEVFKKHQIMVHNSDLEGNLSFLGKTTKQTPVFVNSALIKTVDILAINSIEPHYFAGFTGGAKSIVPGCAGRQTVVKNHSLAMLPDSRLMRTKGNPLFEDLWEATTIFRSLDLITGIQVINAKNRVFWLGQGPLSEVYFEGVKEATEIYGVPFNKPVDHVITLVEPPLDRNLYQAQKALENTKNVIRDGGSLVLVSDNNEGIGNELFFSRLSEFSSPRAVVSSLNIDSYKFGDHKAYRWAQTADRLNLYYVGSLEATTVRNGFMEKLSVDQLVLMVKNWLSNGEQVIIDANGGYTALYKKE